VPEGTRDLVARWQRLIVPPRGDEIEHAQRRCLPPRRPRTALDEAPRRLPAGEHHRIGKRRSSREDRARGLDVSAEIQQGINRHDVVAAGGPVQRRLDAVGILGMGDIRALTSAPAEAKARSVAATLGKRPGQSVATWTSERSTPSAPTIRAFARPGSSDNSWRRAATSPVWMALVIEIATGSVEVRAGRMVEVVVCAVGPILQESIPQPLRLSFSLTTSSQSIDHTDPLRHRGRTRAGANGHLREPQWWATPSTGVPDRKNHDLVAERRVIDVITSASQEDSSGASNR
jgi:hypothetical protein